jgi:hypothetical protein
MTSRFFKVNLKALMQVNVNLGNNFVPQKLTTFSSYTYFDKTLDAPLPLRHVMGLLFFPDPESVTPGPRKKLKVVSNTGY